MKRTSADLRQALAPSSAPDAAAGVHPGRPSKRERILAAGLRLFAYEPYQAVTMDRVAEAAEVAKGTLYLYFQSKEDLYLEILSDGLETIARSYNSTVDPNSPVKGRLQHAITLTIQFYDQRRDLLRLMATEEPRMAQARNRLIQGWRDRGVRFFTSLIDEGMKTGAFRAGDPVLATHAILGGMRSVMLYYEARRPIAEITAEFGALVLHALSIGAHPNGRRPAPAR
ncbi:MAG TPA: TetR/AcrR family transcriptional regulator [Candidatus Binataceae bacterium]|nr:TetR/AcrR family transcriptional regulator [Candidatus Binataceae bacterium]